MKDQGPGQVKRLKLSDNIGWLYQEAKVKDEDSSLFKCETCSYKSHHKHNITRHMKNGWCQEKSKKEGVKIIVNSSDITKKRCWEVY